MWLLIGIVSFAILIYALDSAQAIVAAFFNPEYWALTHILKGLAH